MGVANTKQLRLKGEANGKSLDTAGEGKMESTPPSVRGLMRPDSTTAVPTTKGEPSTLHVNMAAHDIGKVMVGKKVHFHGHGVIKSHHHDEYGHHATVSVHKLAEFTPKYDDSIPLEKNEGVKKGKG